jgi:hypothetical protein
MTAAPPDLGGPAQIAYVVEDLEEAVSQHASLHGSGPFFLQEVQGGACMYRGAPAEVNYRFVLGQWGSLQLEFVQPMGDTSSIYTELPLEPRGLRLHHHCLLPRSTSEAVAWFEARGHPAVFEYGTPIGTTVVMIDTVGRYGHFIELHERIDRVVGLYDVIRSAASGGAGDPTIRPFAEALQAARR